MSAVAFYKLDSLTAEAKGDYGTFSGQYLMGAKLGFNELTGVASFCCLASVLLEDLMRI